MFGIFHIFYFLNNKYSQFKEILNDIFIFMHAFEIFAIAYRIIKAIIDEVNIYVIRMLTSGRQNNGGDIGRERRSKKGNKKMKI